MHRLPNPTTRWVWEIDSEYARVMVEVIKVEFNGEEWWVTTRSLPDSGPLYFNSQPLSPKEFQNDLDRFWEAVTPIGGRLEDLSHEISPEQYKRSKPLA